ncbi:AraC family transcriptional regulator with amidase-like domain [Roseiarcus fermentans]|uniref:AraC family transcriptional regulator with amidase-like domain n=1 Tax=Roseiarcus fermentans TaxID=1473586 RepID=A0A366FVJ5_9HYPH|nr:transcriptional regulator FtrA [Roseiarcus fermentans]RBP17719.1 AraC family transcriptional regulator with amidase-like domain [Roseiarcus fermentans]
MPDLSGPLVVALVYDGLCTFEFGIVAEIFGLSRPEMGPHWYRFASCAVDNGPMRAHGGLVFVADGGPDLIDQANIVVIPGWKGADIAVADGLIARLRQAHERGARLASICSGAFVLASTGLLSGGTITTHWRYADKLRARHPDLQVDDASLYREHNGIFTSAGSAAGIDLMIEMVRRDFGPAAANSVARRLVMPAHRNGGQAQFLVRPVAQRQASAIAPLLDAIRSDLAADWSVQSMAVTCRMSLRTFIRRFEEATGQTPGDWLVSERVDAAQRLLRLERASMEDIAQASGFRNPHALRHHFRKRIGISPTEYRARFLAEGEENSPRICL